MGRNPLEGALFGRKRRQQRRRRGLQPTPGAKKALIIQRWEKTKTELEKRFLKWKKNHLSRGKNDNEKAAESEVFAFSQISSKRNGTKTIMMNTVAIKQGFRD